MRNVVYLQLLKTDGGTMGASTFPIHCFSCDKVYATLTDFIGLTTSAGNEALHESEHDEQVEVTLARTCSCGTVVVARFRERRDTSPKGAQKRQLFDRVQGQLISEGVGKDDAHDEILNLINGRPCPIMKKLAHQELLTSR